jgi:hypothetical protein
MSSIKKLFGGGQTGGTRVRMPDPVVTRMPTEGDTSVLDSARRQRMSAARRKGRQSTIMTDNLSGMTGSSGKYLGS